MNAKSTKQNRIILALGFSLKGLKVAFIHEKSFRLEIVLFFIMAPMATMLGETALEKTILISSLFLVLITELMNSAVEAIVDLVSPEYQELAGRAKDFGSAAVFLALILVCIVWGFLLWPQ